MSARVPTVAGTPAVVPRSPVPVVPPATDRPTRAARPTRPARGPRSARRRAAAGAAALVAVLAACTGGSTRPPTPTPTPTAEAVTARVALPEAPATVVPDGPAGATALAVSRALFAEAPVAVVAADATPGAVGPAATAGVALGAPVLVAGADGLADEIERLGSTDVVVVGDVTGLPRDVRTHGVDPADPAALGDLGVPLGPEREVAEGDVAAAVAGLGRPGTALLSGEAPGPGPTASAAPSGSPAAAPATPAADDVLASLRLELPGATASSTAAAAPRPSATPRPADPGPVRLGADGPVVAPPTAPERAALLVDLAADADGRTAAALATARAAGVPVVDVPGGDPRATSASVRALTGVVHVVALGAAFGAADRLGARVAAASTGVELPGGGQLVFPPGEPGKRYVALYGTPGTPALGVLGEQDVPATIARAQQTAAQYDPLTEDTVVPTLEIIATIASAGPEADGSYSRPRSIEDLRPLVEAAQDAGQAVVIDLQPGRTDFVTQAQQFADLLAYPHVGLALDPEWRLAPDQVHLRQIGSVGIDEVNATAAWLAEFTRERHLPQKMFLLHQFSLRMITERERLDTSHDELATIIHADGQGSQPAKAGTWATLHQGAPPVHWGWKNFYDEDQPMLDPAQTYAVQPTPDLVTYQ